MADIWSPVFWYLYSLTFPAIGQLYQLSLWLQKNWAILMNLCKIMCAQVHFHETIDIKPWMMALMARMQCNTFHYNFATWYLPQIGCIISRRFILNIWHVTQNRPRVWRSMSLKYKKLLFKCLKDTVVPWSIRTRSTSLE